MSEEGVINFDVDSHLLIQLGERSATRRFVALAELIKNSYDADATKATVRMYNVKEPCGKILVEDDGHGMTFETLRKTWMRIATIDKRENPVSKKYRRVKAGEKGVGRIVCRRLSNRLTLKSVAEKKEGTKEETTAHFNWADFEPGTDISDIKIKCSTRSVSKDSKTGTTLILEDTKDAWNESDIKNLRRELYELIDPSYYLPGIKKKKRDTDPGFYIDFDLPEFSREAIKPLEKNIIEGAWGRLSGLVDDKGKAIYTLKIYGEFDKKLEREENFKCLKLANMDVILFLYAREYVKADIGVRKLKNIIRQYSGIKVYYGDFRLFGYGYPGDDWLGLDKDRAERRDELSPELGEETTETKRPGLLLFGNNQLLGYVTYSHRDNPNLKITITREHLEKNEAFDELKRFVRLGIEFATVRHAHEVFLKKKTEEEAELKAEKEIRPEKIGVSKTIEALESIKSQISALESKKELKIETAQPLKESIYRAKEGVDEIEEQYKKEFSMLRTLASTGTFIFLFIHELEAFIDDLEEAIKFYSTLIEKQPENIQQQYVDTINSLNDRTEMIKALGDFSGFVIGRESRLEQKEFVLRPIVDRIIASAQSYLNEYKITVNNKIPKDLRTPKIYLMEIVSILHNLVTNAIKAVKRKDIRIIELSAEEKDDLIVISVLDTGIGIGNDMYEMVFEPFESDSEPDLRFGAGTGLGLWIVRGFVNSYGGGVQFVDPPNNWNTCIRIWLPKEVKK